MYQAGANGQFVLYFYEKIVIIMTLGKKQIRSNKNMKVMNLKKFL